MKALLLKTAIKRPRENYQRSTSGKAGHHQNSSRVLGACESPAPEVPGEVEQIRESRRDDESSHGHPRPWVRKGGGASVVSRKCAINVEELWVP